MRKAHIIMGFSNWGKSTLIQQLFAGRLKFYYASLYKLDHLKPWYSVQSVSNDDKGEKVFLDQIRYRLSQAGSHNSVHPDLICAMCPTDRSRNHIQKIMGDPLWNQFGEKIFYLLENDYFHKKQLDIQKIQSLLANVPGARFEIINADAGLPLNQRGQARIDQLRQLIHINA